ncbi:hypothetical protein TRAPUB_12350 [Trametes pubescens]|uniref:F-box domain-containing protein n=1 Tax=Trametes pubescens TaxID=154538 RepID=A0A1M2VUB8_TRAPU|nr:hypothetical protein TRAPUB_12350 [Trametes pubescens]
MAASTSGNNPEGGHAPASAIQVWSGPDLGQLDLLPYQKICDIADQYERPLENAIDGSTIDDIRSTTITRLRGICNVRSPHAIHRLPTELLVKIIIDVSDISDPRSSRSLIALTHVCREWRAVALDVPEPWSSIVITSLSRDGVYSFVDRSRDSLLNIRWQASRSLVDFRLLADFQLRLRSLIVVADNLEVIAQAVKQLSWRTSPRLKTLCLLGPGAGSVWNRTLAFDPLPVAGEDEPQALPSLTPSLRSLCVRPMVFPWTSHLYTNLSVLDIDTTRHSTLTEGRLLSILRRCPKLVELLLRVDGGGLTALNVSPLDGSWDIALPLLSVFSVDGLSPEVAMSVLSQLNLPTFTRYSLSLHSPAHRGSFIAALPHDRSRLPGLAAIKSLKFEVAADGNTHITLYPSGAPPVALTLTDGLHGTMIPCVPSAALDSLEAIIFIGPSSPSSFILDWHSVLCQLPRVRFLRFDGPSIEDVSRAIDALGLPGTGDLPHSLAFPCPALECLQLVSLPLTRELEDRLARASRRRDEWGLPPLGLEVRDVVGSDVEFASRLRELDLHIIDIDPAIFSILGLSHYLASS